MACGVLIGCMDVGGKSQGQNGANEENDTKYSDLSCGNNDWVKKREEGDTTMTHRSREGKRATKRFQGKDTHGLRKLAIKSGGRGSEACELDGTNRRTQGDENLTTLVERGVLEERHDDTNRRAVARGDGRDGHDCLYGRVHISLSLFSDFIALNVPKPSPSLLPWLDLLNGTSSSPCGHDWDHFEPLWTRMLASFPTTRLFVRLHPHLSLDFIALNVPGRVLRYYLGSTSSMVPHLLYAGMTVCMVMMLASFPTTRLSVRSHPHLSLDFIALNFPGPSPSLLLGSTILDVRVDEALLRNYLEPFSIIGLHPVHPFMPNTNTCLTYHLERANRCHNFHPWLATFEQTWDSLPIDIGGTLPDGTNH
ncbi:hypothetical protein BDR06DRAFT_977832 [Suillus hirtellus]|nr:hypothetical protein BDR06DRAFT_977832 [Suillus hirtellus]